MQETRPIMRTSKKLELLFIRFMAFSGQTSIQLRKFRKNLGCHWMISQKLLDESISGNFLQVVWQIPVNAFSFPHHFPVQKEYFLLSKTHFLGLHSFDNDRLSLLNLYLFRRFQWTDRQIIYDPTYRVNWDDLLKKQIQMAQWKSMKSKQVHWI